MEIAYLGKNNFKLKTKRGVAQVNNGELVELRGNVAKTPFIITQPGEYEVEGMSVFGYSSNDAKVFVLQLDDVRVLAAGAKMDDKLIDDLDTIDVVLLNVDSASSKDLVELVGKVEPSYILPYGEENKRAAFVKEFEHGSKEMDKLTLSKAAIPDELTEVVILSE